MNDPYNQGNRKPKILWSCVARNNVILAEAGEEIYGGRVAETAQGLLKRKATPGFEFHQVNKWQNMWKRRDADEPKIRGCKFHQFEHDEDNVEDAIVWVFAAVYDSNNVEQIQVQSFLEKIVIMTEVLRDETEEWRMGETLACQETFAPILMQRMNEVTYLGKMAMLEKELENSKQIMGENVDMLLDREEKLQEQLGEKSSKLEEMASVFKKRSRKVRRLKMLQNAKHGAIMGTAVTAGVAVIIVPPLVAFL